MELKFELGSFSQLKMKTGELTESKVEGIFLKRTGNRIEGKAGGKFLSSSDWWKGLSSETGGEDENMGIGR